VNKLWRSGVLLSAAGFLSGIANYVFIGIIGRRLTDTEFGYANTSLAFVGLLGLPLTIASTALIHYVAHFRASNDEGRLQGLLAGCRSFLLKLTAAGSLLAILLVKPLSLFLNMPRASLTLAALACVLIGLWASFAMALCQGMSWFKRLAFIGLTAAGLRLAFGWLVTAGWPTAEAAVAATAFSLLANLILFFWRKEIFRPGPQLSPWNREFLGYVILAAAGVGGGYFFTQGDLLVAQRNLGDEERGAYAAANKLGVALVFVVAPMLQVLFTSRSGHRTGAAVREQLRLLVLYAVGLGCGAVVLLYLRELAVRLIFGRENPAAAAMVGPLAITMVFVGLIQCLGMWALASRWSRIAILYGCLGLGYWLVLLVLGTSADALLRIMPVAAGGIFAVLLIAWLLALRKTSPGKPT
jgi:O-antigen/teichoic acid export membrane protein